MRLTQYFKEIGSKLIKPTLNLWLLLVWWIRFLRICDAIFFKTWLTNKVNSMWSGPLAKFNWTSVARKFRAENTKGEPQNTKKNTTLKTKKHHVFGYKNTKYLIKSFKNGPPKHFYCIFVHQFLKNFNFFTEIFQKISIFF